MKQRIPNGIYSKEFREQAVKQLIDEGLSAEAVAKRLQLPKSTLSTWVRAQRSGKLVDMGKNQQPLTEIELELARTKRELAEVKLERDLLKQAAAYFAQEIR